MKLCHTFISNPARRARAAGFTLLELLTVVVILAAVAFVSSVAYRNILENARVDLARSEMNSLAQALRQFQKDTGYFPKQGPFALQSDGGQVSDDADGNGVANAADVDWFYSPVNVDQLLIEPADVTGNAIMTWSAGNRRGWRGPYITYEGYVDVSNDLSVNSAGYPTLVLPGSAFVINVPAIADPFPNRPVATTLSAVSGALFGWHITPTAADEAGRPGSPYLIFGLEPSPVSPLKIVSVGENGEYGGLLATQPCAPATDDDDLVLCLDTL